MSELVKALELLPKALRSRPNWIGRSFVPLNIKCSNWCEMPVIPGTSSLEPTRYHTCTLTTGAVFTSLVNTVKPLAKTVLRTFWVKLVAAAVGCEGFCGLRGRRDLDISRDGVATSSLPRLSLAKLTV